MAQFVHPAIENVCMNPSAGAKMTVILVVEADSATAVESEVIRMDGVALERSIDADMLLVEAREEALEQLCELSGIKSISPDEEMEILA